MLRSGLKLVLAGLVGFSSDPFWCCLVVEKTLGEAFPFVKFCLEFKGGINSDKK